MMKMDDNFQLLARLKSSLVNMLKQDELARLIFGRGNIWSIKSKQNGNGSN